jgi:hypothetical protein
MHPLLSLCFGVGLLALTAGPVAAAPVSPTTVPMTETSDVLKVHGYHRSCRWGPRRGWWHRHVGPYGRPVPCGRVHRYHHPYYRSYAYPRSPGIVLRFGHGPRFHHRRFHRGRW